jgi:hypothetical protein
LVERAPGLAGVVLGMPDAGCVVDSGSAWPRLRAGDSPNARIRIKGKTASRLNIRRRIQRARPNRQKPDKLECRKQTEIRV